MKNDLAIVENYNLIPLDPNNGEPKYIDTHSLKELLNKEPSKNWIKVNKYSQGARYLPIRIVEELLHGIFPYHQINQVGDVKILGNSVVVSVELKVFNPIINQWLSYAGIGAVPIEVAKGAHPTDFTQISPKALHKNVPSALSYAINNAAKKIGRLFGSHLNSNETIY